MTMTRRVFTEAAGRFRHQSSGPSIQHPVTFECQQSVILASEHCYRPKAILILEKRSATSGTEVLRLALAMATQHFRIDNVTIEPLYPVLDEFGQSPGFDFPLALWTPGKTDANPCTISMNDGGRITINITSKVEHLTITGVEGNIPGGYRIENVEINPRHITANLLPPVSQPKDCPWGLEDDITWTFSFNAEDGSSYTSSLTLKHRIEIYAVTSYNGSYKTKPAHDYGIPRVALNFYLIYAKNNAPQPIQNIKDYVTSIVHAVHWFSGFAYDVWHGGAHFAGNGADDNNAWFNVRRWASLLRIPANNAAARDHAHLVNCYDQAGAVWIGITLALDSSNDDELIWRFAEPFGFINRAHLVGWGQTTSPFIYDGEKDPEGNVDADPGSIDAKFNDMPITERGPKRSGFWNHAFLQFNKQALDATCGPRTGEENLDQYLKLSIDYDTGKPGASQNSRWQGRIGDLDQYISNAQGNLERIQNDEPLKKGDFKTVEECKRSIALYQREQEQLKIGGAEFTFIVRAPDESETRGRVGVLSIGSPTDVAIDNVAADCWLKALDIQPVGWNGDGHAMTREEQTTLSDQERALLTTTSIDTLGLQNFEKEIRKELIKGGNGFSGPHDVEPKPSILTFSPDYSHFSWKACSSASNALSIDIYMLSGYFTATRFFAIRTHPPNESVGGLYPLFKAAPSDEPTKRRVVGLHGERKTANQGNTGHGYIIRAVGNVVFEARGLNDNEALEPYEALFLQLLTDEQVRSGVDLKVSVTEPGPNSVEEQKPTNNDINRHLKLKRGEKLKVSVEAEGGFGIRCNLDKYSTIVPLQLNPVASIEKATFEFLARDKGDETLSFVAGGKLLNVDHMKTYKIKVTIVG
ncbi:hypothetical protein FRC07_005114 [Ceratobasidium sp. 392]|nr:hypothetical protein FRC07_005114 [Ceratobasidium sp. 392]